MINADFGCLVIITNFEFLCRKVNFIHVGIVQNLIFSIKSARRFRKTISTLASQRVACIPGIPRLLTVNFWIWEPWMMWREMHGWQIWSKRQLGRTIKFWLSLAMCIPWSMSCEETSVGRWPNINIYVKNYSKHEKHYSIYKCTCFTSNESGHRCQNHSNQFPLPGSAEWYISSGSGTPLAFLPLFYWILTTQSLWYDPQFVFIAGMRP